MHSKLTMWSGEAQGRPAHGGGFGRGGKVSQSGPGSADWPPPPTLGAAGPLPLQPPSQDLGEDAWLRVLLVPHKGSAQRAR